MSYELIVTVVFKLINFFIIVIGSLVIFRLFFKRQVSEKIHEKESFIASLQEKTVILRREQHVLDERIAYDKKYADVLYKKIEAWVHILAQEKQKDMHDEEERKKRMLDKHALQQDYFYKQELYKQIIPAALEEAKKELRQEYASQERQNAFIQTIIQTIKHG